MLPSRPEELCLDIVSVFRRDCRGIKTQWREGLNSSRILIRQARVRGAMGIKGVIIGVIAIGCDLTRRGKTRSHMESSSSHFCSIVIQDANRNIY